MGELIRLEEPFTLEFPTPTITELPVCVGRVNWVQRLGESPYVLCGVTYLQGVLDGGSTLWVLEMRGDALVPVFPWLPITELEMVTLVEKLKEVRGI